MRGSERGRALVDNAFVFGADGVLPFVNPTFDAFAGILVDTVGARSIAAAVDTRAFVYVGADGVRPSSGPTGGAVTRVIDRVTVNVHVNAR